LEAQLATLQQQLRKQNLLADNCTAHTSNIGLMCITNEEVSPKSSEMQFFGVIMSELLSGKVMAFQELQDSLDEKKICLSANELEMLSKLHAAAAQEKLAHKDLPNCSICLNEVQLEDCVHCLHPQPAVAHIMCKDCFSGYSFVVP
jgi:hypothetical protein